MSTEGLLRLAEGGLAAYPPSEVGELSRSCRDLCRALPDVRFCVIADALGAITDWLDWRGDAAAIPNALVAEIDLVLRQLPLIIGEPNQDVAVALASRLQEDIGLLM